MAIISVIVPVYKVEKYLHRCVDSILGQLFTDFELILVDDGSPDYCGKICDEYALIDRRIHVIHKENGGLSDARNVGIDWVFEHSNSEWLTFIDSDDWIHPEYLSFLYRAVNDNEESLSVCPYKRIETFFPYEKATYSAIKVNTQDIFVEKRVNMIIACGKLYKKHDFESIRFPVGRLHEDEFTTYKLLFMHEHIVFVDNELYYYYINEKSIIQSTWNIKRLDSLNAFKQQMKFFYNSNYLKAFESSARALMITVAKSVANLRQHYPGEKKTRMKLYGLYYSCMFHHYNRFLIEDDKSIIRKQLYPRLSGISKWIKKKKANFIEVIKPNH